MDSENIQSSELSQRDIQLASLDILRVIDAVCEKENLTYWLAFGSLIGAVRHNGFIPWDDDLDIAMPRNDYDKLISYFADNKDKLKPLVALSPRVGSNPPFLITRISDTRYKMIGEYGCEVDDLGTFVDVYPLDGIGDNERDAREQIARSHSLVINYIRSGNFTRNNLHNGALKRMAKAVLALFLREPAYYHKRIQDLCSLHQFESSTFVGNLNWVDPGTVVYRRKWFESSVRVPFESFLVPIPEGFDAVLKAEFGDYMTLPSESERVGHHSYSIVRRGGVSED